MKTSTCFFTKSDLIRKKSYLPSSAYTNSRCYRLCLWLTGERDYGLTATITEHSQVCYLDSWAWTAATWSGLELSTNPCTDGNPSTLCCYYQRVLYHWYQTHQSDRLPLWNSHRKSSTDIWMAQLWALLVVESNNHPNESCAEEQSINWRIFCVSPQHGREKQEAGCQLNRVLSEN